MQIKSFFFKKIECTEAKSGTLYLKKKPANTAEKKQIFKIRFAV